MRGLYKLSLAIGFGDSRRGSIVAMYGNGKRNIYPASFLHASAFFRLFIKSK